MARDNFSIIKKSCRKTAIVDTVLTFAMNRFHKFLTASQNCKQQQTASDNIKLVDRMSKTLTKLSQLVCNKVLNTS